MHIFLQAPALMTRKSWRTERKSPWWHLTDHLTQSKEQSQTSSAFFSRDMAEVTLFSRAKSIIGQTFMAWKYWNVLMSLLRPPLEVWRPKSSLATLWFSMISLIAQRHVLQRSMMALRDHLWAFAIYQWHLHSVKDCVKFSSLAQRRSELKFIQKELRYPLKVRDSRPRQNHISIVPGIAIWLTWPWCLKLFWLRKLDYSTRALQWQPTMTHGEIMKHPFRSKKWWQHSRKMLKKWRNS